MELRVLVTRQVQVEADDAATALGVALFQEELSDVRKLHTATVKPLGEDAPDQIPSAA
jgi:hypothetical protein